MGGDGSFTIGPGIWGFIAFFVMAIALTLLVRNMNGRLRRMAYQERDRDGGAPGRDTSQGREPGRPGEPVHAAPTDSEPSGAEPTDPDQSSATDDPDDEQDGPHESPARPSS